MSSHSNIDEVKATLASLTDCLDLSNGLGKDMLARIATNISDRARAEEGPDGEWAANQGAYGRRKQAKGLPVGVGLKHDGGPRMLSLQEIKGEPSITPTEATMTFGTDDASKRKAQWFTAGSRATKDAERSGAKNQPPRRSTR